MIKDMRFFIALPCLISGLLNVHAQVLINEGSSRNYRTIADEDGDHPDWIELHNAGSEWVNLQGYALTDNIAEPDKWIFPAMGIEPGGHLVVFCSGKDRLPQPGQTTVAAILNYVPSVGWNTHTCAAPFTWDGVSNLLIEVCSYNSTSVTLNSIVEHTTTDLPSTSFTYSDTISTVCAGTYGNLSQRRPVVRLNGITVGTADWTNSHTQFPAPYANWYGGAKHAMLFRASELAAAGLAAGPISTIAFNVLATGGATFEEIDIRMGHTDEASVGTRFIPWFGAFQFHTNFELRRSGEDVYLFSPAQVLLDELHVEQESPGHSNGRWPDGDQSVYYFEVPTPGAPNNGSEPVAGYALEPVLSAPSVTSATPVTVLITNPNTPPSQVRYTLDGTDPTASSPLYTADLVISSTAVLKVRAFSPGLLPSKITTASYLIGAEHASAILSISTELGNIYGPQGIFTNWWKDDEIPAYVDMFDAGGELLFSQRTGMQMDGGYGGSRSFPQKSFRLELDNGTLGSGAVDLPLIPDRPGRARYSRLYLRNGSNQHLFLPHKDAAQVSMMAGATNGYHSAWRPVTVYINGSYFGLYEMREKFDREYFNTLENASADTLDLLTLSAWGGPVLRPNAGSADGFWEAINTYRSLDPADPAFWEQADQHIDLTWYTDYIIGQHWMGNTDWPLNNIKLYRSNTTGRRWRFCTTDLETGMAPNGQTDHTFNALLHSSSQDPELPYTNIWQRGLSNDRFRHYYINRFADVMNSAYLDDRIQDIAQRSFDLTRPDMGDQLLRWIGTDTVALLNDFASNHEAFRNDLSLRTPVVRDDIQEFFSLPRQVDVTLHVHPANAGSIRISTLRPGNYPWQGVYFDGVPIQIEAIAEPGFVFDHWAQNGLFEDTLATTFLDTLTTDAIDFDAFFIPVGIGIREHTAHYFGLHPNPSSDKVFITTNEAFANPTRFEVVDLRGVLVAAGSMPAAQQRHVMDIASLPAGSYQARLFNGGHREVLRFVKL